MTLRRFAAPLLAILLATTSCSSSSDSGSEAEPTETETAIETATEATTAEPTEPATAEATEAADDSGATEAIQIEISTADGETLSANYTAVEGAPGVVLGHMRGTGKETWDEFAKAASDAGYAVIAIDSRGYGESSGERDTNLDVDLAAGVDFLLAEGAPSVAVIGASMNGTATIVAGSQLDLAGVATLSAPGEFLGLDAVAAAPAVRAPSLIIVAEDDEPYASAAPSLVGGGGGQLVVYPGSAHGTALFDEFGAALTDSLVGFLDEVTG
jgi:pimeloyl-ACP methyl ester carboxylesterase